MEMNIPATFGPICFSGSLKEDWNVYGRMDRRTDDGRQVMAIDELSKSFFVRNVDKIHIF
jgi:hypothetical protein